MNAGFSWSALWASGRALVLSVLLAATWQPALAAKDTVFGVEIIPANFPNPSAEDVVRSLGLASLIGSHASKIWPWGDPSVIPFAGSMVTLSKQFGLKTMLQMGTIFLGDPAPPAGYAKSFADPATRARFLADVRTLALMKPDYLVLTTEANLMHRFNRVEFDRYRPLYAEAYQLVKSLSPTTLVGVSYLYSLWFANYHVDRIDVPALLKPADFIAFTTYPEWLIREGHFASIAAIPPDWYGASRKAYPDAKIIFSEAGWASKVRGTPELQAEYLRNLPRLMSTTRPHLVTWAVLHDVEFYSRDLLTPESTAFLVGLGVDIDGLFGHFNGMGLLDGFGNPKPGFYTAYQLVFPAP
jgi:hypothetical protein